jgi:hypothetical protein
MIRLRPFKEKEGGEGRSPLGVQWKEKEKVLMFGGQWKEKEKYLMFGGQWKGKEKYLMFGGQWKEKEKVLMFGGQWKEKEKVLMFKGQWKEQEKVPMLGGQSKEKEKVPFHLFPFSPQVTLFKPSCFSFEIKVLLYHGYRPLFMHFFLFPWPINYDRAF